MSELKHYRDAVEDSITAISEIGKSPRITPAAWACCNKIRGELNNLSLLLLEVRDGKKT